MGRHTNVMSAFWEQVDRCGDRIALGKRRESGWETTTWFQFGEKVACLSAALADLGLRPGDKIAIFSDNCPEWLIADYAGLSAGLVTVPIYPNQTLEQVRYVLEHSEARAVFVRGRDRIEKVKSIQSLQYIIAIESQAADVLRVEDLIEAQKANVEACRQKSKTIVADALATISYTSGTTAFPKGVLLTHRNILAEIEMLSHRSIRTSSDRVLSYLTLSHMAERLNQFRQAVIGYSIHFGEGLDTLRRDLIEVRPTSFMGVPRIYEKFQSAILQKMSTAPLRERKKFEQLLALGRKSFELRLKGQRNFILELKRRWLTAKVAPSIKSALGLECSKNFFGGAAPMGHETLLFFYALGMPIIEVYGLTECTGATHYNLIDDPSYGTVGPALPGLECKIASDGEIFLRGPSVFSGYYKDEEATKLAFQGDWFCTGDIGRLDSKGCLRITDRKKSLIVTAAGKNIAPSPLEAKIKECALVSQSIVIGDQRHYLTALITLAQGLKEDVKTKQNVGLHIEQINSKLPSYETIKSFAILEKDFTIETGELTPTLKVKRSFVQEKYKSIIDSLYKSGFAPSGPIENSNEGLSL